MCWHVAGAALAMFWIYLKCKKKIYIRRTFLTAHVESASNVYANQMALVHLLAGTRAGGVGDAS